MYSAISVVGFIAYSQPNIGVLTRNRLIHAPFNLVIRFIGNILLFLKTIADINQ